MEAGEECKAPSSAEDRSICADRLRCLPETGTLFQPRKFVAVVFSPLCLAAQPPTCTVSASSRASRRPAQPAGLL